MAYLTGDEIQKVVESILYQYDSSTENGKYLSADDTRYHLGIFVGTFSTLSVLMRKDNE